MKKNNNIMMIKISEPFINESDIKAVESVLLSGQLAQGDSVKEFEDKFSNYLGIKYSVATSSGTTALQMALLVHGIGPGDEVITTGFTFVATINTILSVGATPVLVDINPQTNNIDHNLIEQYISKKTKAIMPVHLYGLSSVMSKIETIARKYDLKIIEDACQSLGAEFDGQKVGTFGIGCFSFYPTKNITTGEGGMICTNDEELYEKFLLIRNHGMGQTRYDYKALGYNFRMTNIQAALGIGQLERIEELLVSRIKNANIYDDKLKNLLSVPYSNLKYKHVYNQYTIKVDKTKRDKLQDYLKKKNIQTVVYYPNSVNHYPHVNNNAKIGSTLNYSEKNSKEVLSIPVHPKLTTEEIHYVIEHIKGFYND